MPRPFRVTVDGPLVRAVDIAQPERDGIVVLVVATHERCEVGAVRGPMCIRLLAADGERRKTTIRVYGCEGWQVAVADEGHDVVVTLWREDGYRTVWAADNGAGA